MCNCTLKTSCIIISVISMIAGAGVIYLGIVFPNMASTTEGNETILGIGLDAYGAFFIGMGIFGMYFTCEEKRGCMILFLVVVCTGALGFIAFGGYILSQLGDHKFSGLGFN